jgi:hypothetical protein
MGLLTHKTRGHLVQMLAERRGRSGMLSRRKINGSKHKKGFTFPDVSPIQDRHALTVGTWGAPHADEGGIPEYPRSKTGSGRAYNRLLCKVDFASSRLLESHLQLVSLIWSCSWSQQALGIALSSPRLARLRHRRPNHTSLLSRQADNLEWRPRPSRYSNSSRPARKPLSLNQGNSSSITCWSMMKLMERR